MNYVICSVFKTLPMTWVETIGGGNSDVVNAASGTTSAGQADYKFLQNRIDGLELWGKSM